MKHKTPWTLNPNGDPVLSGYNISDAQGQTVCTVTEEETGRIIVDSVNEVMDD